MTKTSFAAIRQVVASLEATKIPYMLVGSFSSNYYSYPRATNDADFVIEYTDGVLGQLIAGLNQDFILDQQLSFETITGSLRNVLTFLPTKFDIELFRLSDDEHDMLRFERRKAVAVLELQTKAVLPTAEDVIIQKLRWQREKDISDARKVLQIQFTKLDWKYIRHWTGKHGTDNLLETLYREAKLDLS